MVDIEKLSKPLQKLIVEGEEGIHVKLPSGQDYNKMSDEDKKQLKELEPGIEAVIAERNPITPINHGKPNVWRRK